jgi:hypothetical protein
MSEKQSANPIGTSPQLKTRRIDGQSIAILLVMSQLKNVIFVA